jgi:amidohydrolase
MVDIIKIATKHRRTLHQIPELTFEEFKTTAYIREELSKLGIEYFSPLETATVVYLKGNSSKTIGFRADIDALPIEEATSLPYSSTHKGAMHACGHDGHASMLLTFAQWCKDQQKSGALKHNVLLIFQPSEESNAGANKLIQRFSFDEYQLEAIFGLHLMPDNPEGTLLTKSGPLTASATEYRVYIEGRSAHVAAKETGSSALGSLTHTVNQIEKLQHYHLSGLNQNVIHIGKMNAGEAINTVASNGYLEGTIRTYSLDDLEAVKSQMQQIIQSSDTLFGTSSSVVFAEGYPPVVNDSDLMNWVEKASKQSNLNLILKEKPYLFGEDFSFYGSVAKTNFAFLGVQNKEKGYTSGLHTSTFNFDEAVLEKGVRYYQQILESLGE